MRRILLAAAIIPFSAAAEQTATATWLAESMTAEAGKELRTVVMMKVSAGWHTYWENPGEGGMPMELKVSAPEGWAVGGLQHPIPKRFMTGDLPGFGYEGEVRLPVTLTPPAGFEGAVPELKATLSWLACNDEACLPGDADIKLVAASEPQLVAGAYDALPKPLPGAILSLAVEGEDIVIDLTITGDAETDPSKWEVFPATRNVIDPASKPRFSPKVSSIPIWSARARKSEYLEGEPKALTLLLVAPGGEAKTVSTASKPE